MTKKNEPNTPKGGWTKPNKNLRCTKCADGDAGTILPVIDIFVKREGPNVAIARVIRCCKCGWVAKRWLLQGYYAGPEYHQGPAEALGITRFMVGRCMDQAPRFTSFTMQELESGTVEGIPAGPAVDNPNRNIEPATEAMF